MDMNATRWQPLLLNELNRFQQDVNRLFGQFGSADPVRSLLGHSYPPVNVWENADSIFVEAELPGLNPADLNVLVSEGNLLTLEGEFKGPEVAKGVWQRRERTVGKFSRVLKLPVPVDADKVQAKFDSGVLTLTLPKSELAKPRKITVQSV
jgi:HSP20 family protein